jgi:hypothetical protein
MTSFSKLGSYFCPADSLHAALVPPLQAPSVAILDIENTVATSAEITLNQGIGKIILEVYANDAGADRPKLERLIVQANKIDTHPSEPDTPAIIQEIAAKVDHLFFITSRFYHEREVPLQLLEQAGLSEFTNDQAIPFCADTPDGNFYGAAGRIIYASKCNRGLVIRHFLHAKGISFNTLLYADDRKRNLVDTRNAFYDNLHKKHFFFLDFNPLKSPSIETRTLVMVAYRVQAVILSRFELVLSDYRAQQIVVNALDTYELDELHDLIEKPDELHALVKAFLKAD